MAQQRKDSYFHFKIKIYFCLLTNWALSQSIVDHACKFGCFWDFHFSCVAGFLFTALDFNDVCHVSDFVEVCLHIFIYLSISVEPSV